MICPNCHNNVDPSNGRCPNCLFPLPGLDLNNNININGFNNMQSIEEFNRNFSLDDNEVKNKEDIKIDKSKLNKNDKKNKKLSLLIVIIIFLLVITLLLGGYIAYDKLFMKNNKVIVKTNTTKEYKLTEQEALGLGNYLWNYALDTLWCRNFNYSEQTTLINDGIEGFEITNYQDVIKHFTSDFTYEYNDNTLSFNDIFENHILNNKYYDVNKCAREINPLYRNTNLTIKLIDKAEINYNAVSTYCENDNCIENKIEKEFTIVKEKNKWKIKNFYLPN